MKNIKSKNESNEEKEKKKIILYIMIIIIMLLLLITSCTSGLLGKIGDLFRNEGNYTIDNDTNDKEEIVNQDLKFDSDQFEMSITDANLKISFSYENINPSTFTCTTSDANIATCYVQDGYVIVNPKAIGEVSIYLQTITNGKIYKASAKVTILEGKRKIELSTSSGTIYLESSRTKYISFHLVGLTGDVTATSSDEKIATATIENGVLKITALKKGNATISLTLLYNHQTYTADYKLTVLEGKNPNAISNVNNTGSSNIENTNNSIQSNDSTLHLLKSNRGTFSQIGNSYYLGVGGFTYSINLTPTLSNAKANMSCTYKRADKENYEAINCFQKLKLKTGDNKVIITVVSEDKTSTSTYTVTINKAYSSKNYLKDISINGKTISGFNKQITTYEVEVDNSTSVIDFSVTPWSKKSHITYTYNGVTISDVSKLTLLEGPNILKIHVTDVKGNTRAYQVIVNRKKTDNNTSDSYLKDLLLKTTTITNVENILDFGFDSHTYEYNLSVAYEIEKISLTATPSDNKNTSILYTYTSNGTTHTSTENSLNNLVLDCGLNEIVITVTNNGSTTNYKVNINRESPSKGNILTNLTIDGFELDPAFASDTLNYKVTVPENTTNITVKGTSPLGTTITYNGSENGTITLKDGNNQVIVKVTDAYGFTREYVIDIFKEAKHLSSDTSIQSILVSVPNETSPRVITTTKKTTVASDIEEVTLVVTPTDYENAKVTYNGLESGVISLNPGNNIVTVVVKAQDNTEESYKVTIYREEKTPIKPEEPKKEIEIVSSVTECYIEKGCSIQFKVVETLNGITNVITNDVFDDIVVNLDANIDYKLILDEDTGIVELQLIPKSLTALGPVTVEFGIPSALASQTIHFKISEEYTLYTKQDSYTMSVTPDSTGENSGTKDIILYTNLFNGNVAWKYENKILTIYDVDNPLTRVEVRVEDPKNLISKVEYKDSEMGPTSLAIAITATNGGNAQLKVNGYVKGIDINKEFTIDLIITQEYIVHLIANGGYFDIYNKEAEYSFKKKSGEIIDLAKYIPFKSADDANCNYFEFLGYSENPSDQSASYTKEFTVTGNTNLYAIYDSISKPTPEDMVFKTIWVDPNIFENKEAKELYGKNNLIYPGAHGYYLLNFENTTENDINIVGFTLAENTVCVEKGCLNMGYIIKYSPKNDNNYTYYLVKDQNNIEPLDNYRYKPQNYRILNGGNINTRNTLEIEFAKKGLENILIEKGNTVTISLFWEWIDSDIDTAIGKKAATSNEEEIYNIYSLSLGINFKNANSCSTNNNE